MMNIKTLAAMAWFLIGAFWLVATVYALFTGDDKPLLFQAMAVSALAMIRTYSLERDNASS